MTKVNEDIISALKKGREFKGISQRELSARTGVPQSHVSKIEGGHADIRLSSLIELARALDLEVKLVPRKVLSAVDSIVRGATYSQNSRNEFVHENPYGQVPARHAYRLDDLEESSDD